MWLTVCPPETVTSPRMTGLPLLKTTCALRTVAWAPTRVVVVCWMAAGKKVAWAMVRNPQVGLREKTSRSRAGTLPTEYSTGEA